MNQLAMHRRPSSLISVLPLFAPLSVTTLSKVAKPCSLYPSDFPLLSLNADLFASLFIVVKPVALGQVDAGKLGIGLEPVGKPLALFCQSRCV